MPVYKTYVGEYKTLTSIDKDLVSLFITTVILKHYLITIIELSSLTLLPAGLNHVRVSVDSGLLLLCFIPVELFPVVSLDVVARDSFLLRVPRIMIS